MKFSVGLVVIAELSLRKESGGRRKVNYVVSVWQEEKRRTKKVSQIINELKKAKLLKMFIQVFL
jgi:hypothetical protein